MKRSPIIGITPEIIQMGRRLTYALDHRYCKAIAACGGVPWILPPDPDPSIICTLSREIDGLLLSGGDDLDPAYYGESPIGPLTLSPSQRTDFEMAMIGEWLPLGKPTLGICLGMQMINVALGGRLIQDIPLQRPESLNHREPHPVLIEAGTRLFNILGDATLPRVHSHHHQGVGDLGQGLLIAGRSPDGIIEALERPDEPFFLAVQWHPERDDRPADRKILESFVQACR